MFLSQVLYGIAELLGHFYNRVRLFVCKCLFGFAVVLIELLPNLKYVQVANLNLSHPYIHVENTTIP